MLLLRLSTSTSKDGKAPPVKLAVKGTDLGILLCPLNKRKGVMEGYSVVEHKM